MLNWRSLTPEFGRSAFLVKGTELSVALYTPNPRFCLYEIRTYAADGFPDRAIIVRDAETVSDAEVKAGVRPKIVGRFDNEDDAINFCRNFD
jgi:hypothetical protein